MHGVRKPAAMARQSSACTYVAGTAQHQQRQVLRGRRAAPTPTLTAAAAPGRAAAVVAAAAAASPTVDGTIPAAASGPAAMEPFRLARPRRPLAWHRFERALFERLRRKEAELALVSGGGAGADEWYFSMYDGPEAHQALLEDSARCAAFADAIAAAAPLLKGRVVLDAGCGAGLLSLLLAAEAGAAHVYAVDASAGACELARRVVKANGLEARVTVIHARIEAVSLPVDKVDAIVCDWMGAALLHDSLLPALAACRDRWLAPGGLMLPDVAALFVMGVDDRQHLADKRAFWHARQMGDFDFSSVLNAVVRHPRQDTLARPRSQAVTGAARVLGLDLYKATQADLTFAAPFELSAQREGRVSALLAYFDVAFTCRGRFAAPAVLGAASAGGKAAAESSGSSGGGSGGQAAATAQGGGGGSGEAVVLTTHPLAPATGWLQTLFSFPRALQLAKGDALAGSFAVRPAGRPVGRMLDVNVEVKFQGATAKVAYAMRRPLQRTL